MGYYDEAEGKGKKELFDGLWRTPEEMRRIRSYERQRMFFSATTVSLVLGCLVMVAGLSG